MFRRGAFKKKSCRKGIFSRGAFKDRACGKDMLGGGASKDKSCGKEVFSLGQVLATKSHAEGIAYRKCFQGYAMQEGCA